MVLFKPDLVLHTRIPALPDRALVARMGRKVRAASAARCTRLQACDMAKIPKAYDYVIVGAGSAGCTLTNRLTEDHDVRVLVLEAGGWDRHPFLKLPLGWGKVLVERIYDWGYDSEPQETMAGRRIEVARGKVMGGSSSINAMAYVRGNRADYDRWASRSLPNWSYANVLPYFRKQESW